MLSLVVLYVADLDSSRRFYELLGLDLVEERHEGGPVHYSAQLPGGTVLELYPSGDRSVTHTRLGFMVRDRAAVAAALRSAGFTVKRQSLAIDPDGSRVEITDAEAISQRETDGALSAGLGRDEVTWLDDGDRVERP
ncbi:MULTISPECIES: VOC family protein [Mycobacteriaceae]|uniref:Glyoxalase-like domain n=1 Tax=Mycobacteroides abscessus TaxID=36809 RepID=A0AB33SZV7_9MYCO|nr:VOC family protein [Mycobacteroides abscessus]CPT03428.1 Glyoxalase-like domain [Mycobacteroides abscessus]CPT67604.1 Glyoxalase-like domain [Mycobacteroides abscessus]CPT68789.1 Glyoxalase-like domain [Mycobacteroides abscessus]CPV12375.1 Glyoxalase-like domain [Mycobacteroides abscessus]CPV59179.1 Glyoxalase-like domain [Mycobacteroides abscessus]